jgi:peptidoglycan/xylan/chitin deacetylase (PgdA/CDA1 family)
MNPRPKKLQVLRWLPTRWVLTCGSRRRRVLHLTFDDGPHPEHTPVLLDLLAKHRVRATFYLIGQQVERHTDLVRRLVSEGHGLGNHSWSHPHFDRLSLAEQRHEIEHTERLLARFDGQARHDFRPPRGVMPVPMVLDCIRRGRRIAFWSYDSLDYSQRSAEALIEVARRHPPRGGDVVLMHDDGGLSLQVLETMLPLWKAEGFAFEPVPSA